MAANSEDLSTDYMNTWQQLMQMGYEEDISFEAAKKYKKNLESAIDFIEKSNDRKQQTKPSECKETPTPYAPETPVRSQTRKSFHQRFLSITETFDTLFTFDINKEPQYIKSEQTIKSGFLFKAGNGAFGKLYKQRLFELFDDGTLNYFEMKNGVRNKKGCIELNNESTVQIRTDDRRKFTIHTKNRNWFLYSKHHNGFQKVIEWCKILKDTIKQLNHKNSNNVLKMIGKKDLFAPNTENFIDCKLASDVCVSCSRIKHILHSHFVNSNNARNVYQELIANNDEFTMSDVLDDYEHCIRYHEFDDLYRSLKRMVSCDDCICMIRNYRDRVSDGDGHTIKALYNCNEMSDDNVIFLQICDQMHCFYLHSYDLGLKISKDDYRRIDETIDDQKYDAASLKIKELQNIISKKKENSKYYNKSLFQFERLRKNKFVVVANNDDAFDEEKDGIVVSCDVIYNFGYRYFYWEKWRKNDGKHDWFIASRFGCLKEELMDDYNISNNEWKNIIYKKGICHLNKKYTRMMTAEFEMDSDAQNYGIKRGSVIGLQHLIAMSVYCNYDRMQYKLSSTFRKLSKNEEYSSVKTRHSMFANWARLLRECVELFGTQIDKGNIHKFYHGIAREMVFLSTICSMKGCLSTSQDICVALNFAQNKGIIMQICAEDFGYNKYLNCCYLSEYTNEMELFFIGGKWNFAIDSIIHTQIGEDYAQYLKPMNILNRMCKGEYYRNNTYKSLSNATKLCCKFLVESRLQLHRKSGFYTMPKYIESLLVSYTQNVKEILINYYWMKRECIQGYHEIFQDCKGYKFLFEIFFNKKSNGFLSLDNVFLLFPNIEKIQVDGGEQFELVIDRDIMMYIVKYLDNDNGRKYGKLKQIVIKNVKSAFAIEQEFIKLFDADTLFKLHCYNNNNNNITISKS